MFKGISVGAGAIPLLTSHLCFYVSRSCVYRFGRPSLGLRAARGGSRGPGGARGASRGQGGQPGPGGASRVRAGSAVAGILNTKLTNVFSFCCKFKLQISARKQNTFLCFAWVFTCHLTLFFFFFFGKCD